MRIRHDFLKTVGMTATVVVIAPMALAQALKALRANVILVMTDDQGYCDLACHGKY